MYVMRNSKIRKMFGGLLMLLLSSQAIALPLKIGDKIPNVFLNNIYRYRKSSAYLLDEFGGKPLIIDFWFSGCSACFEQMPKLDSLQEMYGGQLEILMSTFDSKEKAVESLSKPFLKQVRLPSVVSDTILMKKIFPHVSEPHEVWIDRNGFVIAITDHRALTKENIEKFINNEKIDAPFKNETTDPDVYWGRLPFIIIDEKYNAGETKLEYSFIGTFNSQILSYRSPLRVESDGEFKGFLRIQLVNCELVDLYRRAYENNFKKNQMIIDKNIVLKYTADWYYKKNIFCYDLISKDTSKEHGHRKMINDLDSYFSITSSAKCEYVDCYVLSALNNSANVNSKVNFRSHEEINGNYVINGTEWSLVFDNFINGELHLPMEVIDETDIDRSKKVDISIPSIWTDLDQVNELLKRYELVVRIEKRLKKVLYLTQN